MLLKSYMNTFFASVRFNCALRVHTVLRTLALLMPLTIGAAQAHHAWLEQSAMGAGATAKFYFGEFGENLREASPGYLDRFVRPVAFKIGANGAIPAPITKTADGFSIAAAAGAGEALVAEESAYPISERKEGDKTIRNLYHPAARLAGDIGQRHEARLTLDLVPTGQAGADSVELQVIFKGKPLPKVKVGVITPSGWMQEQRSGDDGKLRVTLPWQGTYVLEVGYADNNPGERVGAGGNPEKYDRARYVTSLTLMQSRGLPPLPAAPAAPPNRMN